MLQHLVGRGQPRAGRLCNNHKPVPQPGIGDAQLLLLAQAHVEGPRKTTANFILTRQPFEITPDWSEQTVQLSPDLGQWTCLGARHDLTDVYGYGDIAAVIGDVNVDLIFILCPLTIPPIGAVDDLHRQWAAIDYKVEMQHLPKGPIMWDTVQIEYPE